VKFQRFRLTGFKSFVEPTEVPIEAGLTGVVGPNGCGKSNLVEALQWAMGESSYKAMRGSGMEDVIFSGSVARPPRNSAEVTLTLDNSERDAPGAFNDSDTLEVARRIEREAGSTYRVNGHEVRARDVQLLFADASIGAHSAAIVSQGRVGSLIQAKPEARRAVLEEAAGIFGLFGRRHEAELRLKAAEQNLERLEDVLGEIERQLEALRRQARQAVRYRKLSGDIRKTEATALAIRHRFATDAVASARSELEEAGLAVAKAAEQHAGAAKRQAEASAQMPALRDEATAANAAVQRLTLESERLESEEKAIRAQIEELGRRLEQMTADMARERALLADSAETLAQHERDKAEINSHAESHEAKRSEATERLQQAEADFGKSEQLMAEANSSLAELKTRRGQIHQALAEATAREERVKAEQTRVAEERATITAAAGGDRLDRTAEDLRTAETRLGEAERAALKAEREASEARVQAATRQSALAEAESKLARMETEATALRSLLPDNQVASPLIAEVTTREGMEAALAAVLSDELELSTDPADPAHWRWFLAESDPPLPPGIPSLAAFVQGPRVLSRRLAQTGVVDAGDGARLQAMLKPGQTLVSREGDLWRWDGLVARAEARKAATERLHGRRRLTEVVEEIEAFRPAVADASERLSLARTASETADAEETETRQAWRDAQKALDSAREESVAAERRQAGLASRLGALSEADTRLAASLEEIAEARGKAKAELEEMASPDSFDEPIGELQSEMNQNRNAVAEARMALAAIERDAESRAVRLDTIARDEAAWAQRRKAAEAQIASLTDRHSDVTAQRQALGDKPEAIAKQRQDLLTRSADVERKRAEAGDALAEAEARLAEADKSVASANQSLSESREKRGRLEERLEASSQRQRDAEARIRETLHCDPAEAARIAGIEGDDLPALDEIETRLDRYKNERERLGGVNLQADAEAEELAGRRESMISDRDDLVAAINKLRQGIANLNREGRERLTAAFDQVNAQFQRLFVDLFGGGTAELKLIGSDDPLEAGLEVIAKPPGKKPQTMTLLSGGEQALTALSLIFAVFLTKPAPICVLDEVDAPLDDANVERFCSLLEDITSRTDTRFLVITHNPITMSRMNRLFGVTMTERGVSQLVSVDLETAEQFREAS
jgi:chromosome segregation protein